MTFSAHDGIASYAGDGSTTAFSTGFSYADLDDVKVALRTDSTGVLTNWTRGTQYTLTAVADPPAAGTVTVETSPTDYTPASGETLVIWLEPAIDQLQGYTEGDEFPASAHEDALDNLARILTWVKQRIARIPAFPEGDPANSLGEIPNSVDRASKTFTFDANGAPTATAADPITDGFSDGSAASPSGYFTNDTDTGFFRIGTNTMGFSTGGSQVATMSSNQFTTVNGTAAAPGHSFFNDGDTGMYRASANALGIATGGTRRIIFDSSGNLLVGASGATPTDLAGGIAMLNGTAASASLTDGIVLYAEDAAGSSELKVRDEAGNVATLSPHNLEMFTPDAADPYPWSFYHKNDFLGIEMAVDMAKLARLVEQLSGEQLIYVQNYAAQDWEANKRAQLEAEREAAIQEKMQGASVATVLPPDGNLPDGWIRGSDERVYRPLTREEAEALVPTREPKLPPAWLADRIRRP